MDKCASRSDQDKAVQEDSTDRDDETDRNPAAGASSCWQASATWEAAVSQKLHTKGHSDSGYSTLVPQAPSEHPGVGDLVWEPSPGAEGSHFEPAAAPGSHSLGHQTEPEALGPPHGGAGQRSEAGEGSAWVEGGRRVKTLETQRGGDGQNTDSGSQGHTESLTHEGGLLGEVHGKTAAKAHGTKTTAADTDAQQRKPRRRKSNDFHRPKLKGETPAHRRRSM
ncbi:uncharacterized protein LOC118793951 [Megalops cyprinoides]|uniref:uncharacterized protein LOC118793951 n=1 Tax=Megalops cyprinoides TaxID=118141 RepID=UPI0018648AF0|nr:uncharacterized protein LOC118793951 [Megalops cyprinoides]